MAETDYSKFRLGGYTLADLDALAASAGSRTQAVREAVAYWRRAVEEAARANVADLDAEAWTRLAHLNHPDPMPSEARDDEERSGTIDWSARLATELATMYEGRELILPAHRLEAKACKALAKRIAGWGVVRGFALYSALRYFWDHPDAGVSGGDWWHPETWLTAEAK